MKHTPSQAKQLALAALFGALCLIGTLLLPIPLANGYFNVGDTFVLLAGWFLGPLYGGLAAGVGSALADLLSGYTIYAPFTFVIKFFVACVGYCVWYLLKQYIRKPRWDASARILSAILAESCMVVGYLLTETFLYGLPTAVTTMLGNGLQGACCVLLATATLSVIYPIKSATRFFPHLKIEP